METANSLVEQFNKTKYFADLKPCYKSDIVIPRLHKEGFKFVGITACGNNPETVKLRKQNIEKYFNGMFEDIICVNKCVDKKHYLQKYNKSIWVEDSYKNAKMGSDLGHKTFLVKHKHNEELHKKDYNNKITIVDDWEDIEYNLKRS